MDNPPLPPSLSSISISPTLRYTKGNYARRKCFRIFNVLLDQEPREVTMEWLHGEFGTEGLGCESWFCFSVAVDLE